MLSLVDDFYTAFYLLLLVISSALLIVLFRIIPRLPLTRTKNYVECRAQNINTSANYKHNSPFGLRWLKTTISCERAIVDFIRIAYLVFSKILITDLSMICPTVIGARSPARLAIQLVKDIKIPANLGEMSR